MSLRVTPKQAVVIVSIAQKDFKNPKLKLQTSLLPTRLQNIGGVGTVALQYDLVKPERLLTEDKRSSDLIVINTNELDTRKVARYLHKMFEASQKAKEQICTRFILFGQAISVTLGGNVQDHILGLIFGSSGTCRERRDFNRTLFGDTTADDFKSQCPNISSLVNQGFVSFADSFRELRKAFIEAVNKIGKGKLTN